MYQPKYGTLLYERLSECDLKTGTKLMTFCECGKKIIMMRSLGLMSKISGLRATVVRKGTGNNGMDICMDTGDIPK
jgi:hypothetical protein